MAKYLYGEEILPELSGYDKAAYPYLYIDFAVNKAYAFRSPLTNVTGSFMRYVTPEEPFLRSAFALDADGREYWAAWETVTESEEIALYGGWANHDVVQTNGTVFIEGADPTRVHLPLLLYEGKETTTKYDYINGARGYVSIPTGFAVGDTLRVTINGDSGEYIAERWLTTNQGFIGNEWLDESDIEDDGGDWLVACAVTDDMGLARMIASRAIYLCTRTAGDYDIKVELLATSGTEYEDADTPEPDDPLYRDNSTITLGSGTLYLTEYDGETLPDVETVCVEENRMGYTKGGAALQYTEETTEEKDDLGYVAKIVTTKTDVVLKCGLITWNAYTLYKLIDRCTVEIKDGKRVVKIGGKGNENGNKYVVVFHHEDPIDGDLWAVIVGRNTAGFTITCTNEAGALIEPEFKALPHDTDGTLVRLIEGSPTRTN